MKDEIEAKFLQIDHQLIREKLKTLGATCEQPMRLMRRVTFGNEIMSKKGGWIRIRDEGDKTTCTYKQVSSLTVDGVKEIEIEVSNFEQMVEIFKEAGFQNGSFQESKRETWKFNDVEIMLDEWPWLKPYIEVEGHSEDAIKKVAEQLELDWNHAKFGDVMVAYREDYPHLNEKNTVGRLEQVRFDMLLPDMFKNK